MLTVLVCVAAVVLLVLWLLVGPRRCRFCGARIPPGDAPLNRTPICWRCW